MKWHAQRVRCSVATIVRGYRQGGYGRQSPYQAIMLVLTQRGRHEIQGFLSDGPLRPKDFKALRILGKRMGVQVVATRRRGREVSIRG